MPNQLFDDDVDDAAADGPLPTDGPAWGAPVGAAPPSSRGDGYARWKWSSLSRGQRIGLGVALGFAGLLALSALGKRSGGEAADPPPTTTATSTPPAAPSTAEPQTPPELVQLQEDRLIDDPLRGLPDLNYPVVAVAGGARDRFANVVHVAQAGGANICNLWMRIDSEGWQVVPSNGVDAYPNDYFPIRVFVGPPCQPMAGNSNPVVKPA